MKIFTLLHKLTDKGTVNLGGTSRIPSGMVREWFGNTSQTLHFTRLAACAAFLLFIGVSQVKALDATIKEGGTNDWSGLNTTTNTVTWPGVHVTFSISEGPYSLDDDHLLMYKNRTMIISWDVDDDYTINVTKVTMKGYSTLEGYMTVGTKTSGNLYSFTQSNSTFDSQDLSLSNEDNLTAVTSAPDSRATLFHIREVTITYTIEGEEQTVMFDGTADWGNNGVDKFAPDSFRIRESHVTFALKSKMKQYNNGKNNATHQYFYFKDSNDESPLKWWVDRGYTINVSAIAFKAWNKKATFAERGKGYVRSTASGETELKLYQDDDWHEKSCSTTDEGTDLNGKKKKYLFGSTPAPLSNNDYFTLKSTTNEWQIKWITLTYTISPKTYTVSLDSEGGSDGSEDVTLTFDSNAHDEIINPTKDGCTFEGWYSGDNGTGSLIIAADGTLQENVGTYTGTGGIWKKDADDITLHAKWSGVPYSVHFNGNGNTGGGMSNQAFTYGTAQNLTANAFSKTCTVTYDANGGDAVASSVTSFAFEGWAETAGGAKKYDDEQEVSNLTSTEDAVVDLYAKWSAEADSVKLPMPTKENYAFVGWYDANEDSIGSAGDTIAPTGSMTLKAHWRPGVGLTKDNINAGGDIVVTTEHVRFRLHSEDYSIVSGDDGGFKVWDDMPTNTTKNVTLTWEKTLTNGSYDITVTRITFKAKAYNSNYFNSQYGQMSFNGGGDFCIGTNSPWEDKGWSSTIGGNGTYASGVIIKLINTKDAGSTQTFDYHIKDFQIEYTITPHTPNASNTDLAGTLSLEAKQTVDVSTLFSLSHPASDFEYTYRLKEAYANAGMDGTNFYATRSGDYEVQGCIASGTDHEASAWSTATIHVTRTCVFDNGKRGGDKDWQKTTNWDYGIKPDDTDAVRVIGDLTIDESISVLSLAIEDTAIVNIAPTGGLTVGAGGISGATKDKLILRADKGAAKSARKGQTGYLRISPEYTGAMPEAALELYSVAYHDMSRSGDDVAVWQAVGAPISDAGVSAKSVYTKSWIYSWDEEADDWVNNRKTLTFKPFTGYITSQYKYPEGITLTYNGHIVSGRTSQVIDLAYSGEGKGHNLLANSYAAPIDISRFNVDDFYHATPTIYIQNAGTCAESSSQMDGISAEKAAAPGQYLAVPINTAASLASTYDYPILLPAMQGFWVDATADDGTLTLDYNRLVWNADYSTHPNVPLRAPQYKAQEVTGNESEEMPQVGSLQISLEANGWYDNLFMLESERYNTAYEPGSDALKKESGTLNIFTLENDDKLAIDATNSILGTRVGVRTGAETAYTMTFSHVNSQEELALYDSETEQTIDINEGTQYTFFAEPNAMITERFEIVARADAPAITTGVDNVENGAKVHKFIKDNQLFILKNGVLYNATGAVVR